MSESEHIEFTSSPRDAANLSFLVPYYRSQKIYGELCNLCNTAKQISMLHPDVLALLYHFGKYGERDILELGPFVGGSTIAFAWGMKERVIADRLVSIEIGGRYDHPTLGTDDIVRDLRKNLENFGVADQVSLIIGNSRDISVIRQVQQLEQGNGFGVMFIDTDGHIGKDFDLYCDMLQPGAYLIIDDYLAPGAAHKMAPTRTGLKKLVAKRIVESLGVYGWGTWVGRLRA